MTPTSSRVDGRTEARPANGASLRLPALLLWTEELSAIPDDASEAALRRLRAEALKTIERVEAATEAPA